MNEKVHIGAEILNISRLINNELRRKIESIQIPSSFRPFLFSLYKHQDGLTQKELVKITNFKAPTVSLTLQKMKQAGFIKIETKENDSRYNICKLSKKGESLAKEVEDICLLEDKLIEELFAYDELENLKKSLKKIKKFLEGEKKDENI